LSPTPFVPATLDHPDGVVVSSCVLLFSRLATGGCAKMRSAERTSLLSKHHGLPNNGRPNCLNSTGIVNALRAESG
jgi:hypothetical protein